MVVVSASKRLLINKLAHEGIQLPDVFAPLDHQPVIPLKLFRGPESEHYADIFLKNASRLS